MASVSLPAMPPAIEKLPRDERGYPIPWFTAYIGAGGIATTPDKGKPDLRLADPRKAALAMREGLCWVCGQSLPRARGAVFVVGPASVINRFSAEPPSHKPCAQFSVKACPHLSRPKAKRRMNDLPEGTYTPIGQIEEHPTVMALWTIGRWPKEEYHPDGFEIPAPASVSWYTEGREADRDEVVAAMIVAGRRLRSLIHRYDSGARDELHERISKATAFIPGARGAIQCEVLSGVFPRGLHSQE